MLSTNQSAGYHTLRCYGVLNVTNNYIAWDRGTARVWDTTVGIGTYYPKGTHILVTRDIDAYCDANGNVSVYIDGALNTTFTSGSTGGTAYLPNIPRASVINSFTGSSITGKFKATYTSKNPSFENRLRISIPHVKALDTFRNYVSGTEVSLSQSSIDYIKNYTSKSTVTLGGVIETWNGNSKVGESTEINITGTIAKGGRLRVNGQWKEATLYLRVNGQWKEVTPYIRINGQWKEGI